MSSDHDEPSLLAHYEDGASTYDSINSFKKEIARQLLQLCAPIDASSVILDNACGTGIVTGEVQQLFAIHPAEMPEMHAVDFSPNMIDELQRRGRAEKWTRVHADVMDAERLSFAEDKFSHSFTNFGIFLFPDPVRAAREIHRTLAPGGTAVVTSWLSLQWLDRLQAVQRGVRADETPWAGPFAAWMGTEKLRDVMLEGGFPREKLRITHLKTVLRGKQRDLYLGTMRPAWTVRATKGWHAADKAEFERRLIAAFEELKADDTGVELVTSVAVAEK